VSLRIEDQILKVKATTVPKYILELGTRRFRYFAW